MRVFREMAGRQRRLNGFSEDSLLEPRQGPVAILNPPLPPETNRVGRR